MSKKNLAKTTIEGGRARFNKWERRNSFTVERASERDYCHFLKDNPDFSDEDDVFITQKEKVRKEFDDKLGPMYRWLHSQVGRLWDDVKSDVCEKFDSRTTAGRHILYDHLLSSVEEVPDLRFGRFYKSEEDYITTNYKNDFYVDEDGILRAKIMKPRRSKTPKFNTQAVANWLGGRIVGRVGDKLFWFVPVNKSKKYGGTNRKWKIEWGNVRNGFYSWYNGFTFSYLYEKPIYQKNKEGVLEISGHELVWQTGGMPSLRQDRKLNDKEMVFWNSMPAWVQTKVLERSPTYPENLKPKYNSYPYYY